MPVNKVDSPTHSFGTPIAKNESRTAAHTPVQASVYYRPFTFPWHTARFAICWSAEGCPIPRISVSGTTCRQWLSLFAPVRMKSSHPTVIWGPSPVQHSLSWRDLRIDDHLRPFPRTRPHCPQGPIERRQQPRVPIDSSSAPTDVLITPTSATFHPIYPGDPTYSRLVEHQTGSRLTTDMDHSKAAVQSTVWSAIEQLAARIGRGAGLQRHYPVSSPLSRPRANGVTDIILGS